MPFVYIATDFGIIVTVVDANTEALAHAWALPIIPCNLCGSQEGLKIKRMKKLVRD